MDSKLNANDKMTLFKLLPLFLIYKQYNFNSRKLLLSKNLMIKHCFIIRTLSQPNISVEELQKCQETIFEIQRRGLQLYSIKTNTTHDKDWITINSHYMQHTTMNTKRFGCPRITAVFAFESVLGIVKKWNLFHKNGISEGANMLNALWSKSITSLIVPTQNESRDYKFERLKPNTVISYSDDLFFKVEQYNQDCHSLVVYAIPDVVYDIEVEMYYFRSTAEFASIIVLTGDIYVYESILQVTNYIFNKTRL